MRSLLMLLLLFLPGCLTTCDMVGQAEEVVREEFGPRELFRRYMAFKDLAAGLDSMRADIEMYRARLAALEAVPRGSRSRIEQQEIAQVRAELIGIRAKYNHMAAEYNANMAKVNYRFANIGMLPEGATEPLPREFRLYERGE